MEENVIPIYRGSDCVFAGVLSDELGTPIDLTGGTISAFEPSPVMAPHLTLAITNAVAGAYSGRIEWNDAFPNGQNMQFRLKFTIGGDDKTGPVVWVNVQ